MGGALAPRVIDDLAFNPRNRWRFTQDVISKFLEKIDEESAFQRGKTFFYLFIQKELLCSLWIY